jgi:hypothetical protein
MVVQVGPVVVVNIADVLNYLAALRASHRLADCLASIACVVVYTWHEHPHGVWVQRTLENIDADAMQNVQTPHERDVRG